MIAVTSHRPHNISFEYARNQIWARKSWSGIFDEVIYVSNHEPDLMLPGTVFLGYDGLPTIRDMAIVASRQSCPYVALINADIILTPDILKATAKMAEIGILGATSYRYCLDPIDYPNLSNSTVQDKGLDIWVTTPHIWGEIANTAPDFLRMACAGWDCWLAGYMCDRLSYAYRHFTNYRCVFHPNHGDRPNQRNDHYPHGQHFTLIAKLPGELDRD